jgi:hypothetical protein
MSAKARDLAALGLRQDDVVTLYPIRDVVPCGEVKSGSHRQRDRRLRLAGQFAGNHCRPSYPAKM